MMNMVTRSFMRLCIPVATLVTFIALAVFSLVEAVKTSSSSLYLAATCFTSLSLLPATLIYTFFVKNRRVLVRTPNTEITYHPSYTRVPVGLMTFMANYQLDKVEDAIVLHLSMHTDVVINRGFDRVNLQIEFCPPGLVQGSRRDRIKKIGGLLYENKLQVAWVSEDHAAIRTVLRHELGHILLDINHPEMSITKQHEVLTKCHV